jgi:hypothetical protein
LSAQQAHLVLTALPAQQVFKVRQAQLGLLVLLVQLAPLDCLVYKEQQG